MAEHRLGIQVPECGGVVPERDEGAKGGEARPDNPVLYILALNGTRADLLAETAELERRLLGALRPQGVTR